MSTLLLQLVGPMQSWGVQSDFIWRETGREPSKSGVIGLLCAALGRKRHKPIGELAELTMGVRVDQEGIIMRDFHTAGKDGFRRADGKKEGKNVIISFRDYLADAAFLVGLESDDLVLLQTLHKRLRNPVWPLYLGRKAFVPGIPVWLKDGLVDKPLLNALVEYPCLGQDSRKLPAVVRVVFADPSGEVVRPARPLSFAPRRFAPRRVTIRRIELPQSEET